MFVPLRYNFSRFFNFNFNLKVSGLTCTGKTQHLLNTQKAVLQQTNNLPREAVIVFHDAGHVLWNNGQMN